MEGNLLNGKTQKGNTHKMAKYIITFLVMALLVLSTEGSHDVKKLYNRTYWQNAPDNTTPLNAENLDNIEAGIDGLDDRVVELKSDLVDLKESVYTDSTHDSTTNYIDKTSWTANTYINGGVDGQPVAYNGLFITDFVELEENTTYYRGGLLGGYYAYYDENKNYISGHDNDASLTNPFQTPSGIKYGRFTSISESYTGTAWIFTENVVPPDYAMTPKILKEDIQLSEEETNRIVNLASQGGTENPCNYNGNEISVFNKILCIGDSLTRGTFNHNEGNTEEYVVYEQYSYPTYLAKMTGCEVVNLGWGGHTSVMWWDKEKNTDFSGYDCAIINLGVNDVFQNVSIEDTRTALNNIINALKTANNGIKIFMVTIIPAYADNSTAYDNVNTVIRDIANSTENCYLEDMTVYGNTHRYTPYENGHLSALGYHRLAKDHVAYISYIISENMEDFRNVQFIGTDYNYTN